MACLRYLTEVVVAQAAVAAKILSSVCRYWNPNGLDATAGACGPLLLARHTPRLARSEVAWAFVFMCGHVYPWLRAQWQQDDTQGHDCVFLFGGGWWLFFFNLFIWSLLLFFFAQSTFHANYFHHLKNNSSALVFHKVTDPACFELICKILFILSPCKKTVWYDNFPQFSYMWKCSASPRVPPHPLKKQKTKLKTILTMYRITLIMLYHHSADILVPWGRKHYTFWLFNPKFIKCF